MRNSQLFTSYLQATFFFALGLRAVSRWTKTHDAAQSHMALATGLFGLSSLISALNTTFFDTTAGELVPRWISVTSGIITYLSIYAFLLFLSNFIHYPRWVHALSLVATAAFIVLSIIERPDRIFDPNKGVVPIPGVSNPIPYLTYVGYAIAYLAVAFGALWVAFAIYGFRVRGLARFRMLSIAGGFFLLFVVIGLLPRLLFGNPSSSTITSLLSVVRYVALGSAPLLLIGFTPPRFVTNRFTEPSRKAFGE